MDMMLVAGDFVNYVQRDDHAETWRSRGAQGRSRRGGERQRNAEPGRFRSGHGEAGIYGETRMRFAFIDRAYLFYLQIRYRCYANVWKAKI